MGDNITASGDLTHYVKDRLFDDGSDTSLSNIDARNNYHFLNITQDSGTKMYRSGSLPVTIL